MLLKECTRKGRKSDTEVHPKLQPIMKLFEELTISDGGLIMPGERVVLICRAIEENPSRRTSRRIQPKTLSENASLVFKH